MRVATGALVALGVLVYLVFQGGSLDLPIATIGSSGAVAALIGSCLVRFPRENLTYFAQPVAVLAAAWVAAQLLVARLDLAQPVAGDGGDVAYLAQLGGLLAGAAAAWTQAKPKRGLTLFT